MFAKGMCNFRFIEFSLNTSDPSHTAVMLSATMCVQRGMYIVGMSSTLEVFVCGCLWKWTGDLSAAIAACLVFNAPDYYFLGKSIKDPKTWM